MVNMSVSLVSSASTAYSGNIEDKPEDLNFLSKVSDSAGDCSLMLDVGSGPNCQAARFLSSTRRRICCIEVNRSALSSALLTAGPCADGVMADMTQMHRVFRHGIFDLVCCFYSLQHISQPFDCLRNLLTLTNGKAVAISAFLDRDDDHPLPPLLKSCYKSFLKPGEVGKVLKAEGWRHFSWIRNEVYVESNEFPCQREYVIGRRSLKRSASVPDNTDETRRTAKARRKVR